MSRGTDPEEPSSEPPDPSPPASLAPLGTGSPARFDELSGRGGRKKLGLAPGEGPARRPAPPEAFRFRPGESGNPGGRPRRGSQLTRAVARALAQTVEATENGRPRRITKLEAAVTQLVNRAAGGDQRAAQFVLKLLPEDPPPPSPRAPQHTSDGDALVIAEVVRRFSRPTE